MNNAKTTAADATRPTALLETLEARQLRSATPAVVAYLPSWDSGSAVAAKLKSNGYSDITHLNYFSVLPTNAGVLPGTSVNGKTNTSQVTSSGDNLSGLDTIVTAAHKAGKKVNIVIGGAGSDSDGLRSVVNGGSTAWNTLAASIKQFASKHKVDGVDLDWEPASLASNTQRTNYGKLIAAIDAANPSLYLSAAVNAEKLDVSGGSRQYVLDGNAVQHLDHVMVMAYDLEANNVSRASLAKTDITAWAGYVGNSKKKLIFGLPFYGTQGTDWDHTVQADTYANLIARKGSLPSPTADSMTLNGQTWTYNGPKTIYDKTDFAIDNGYAGVGVWAITQDYLKNGNYDNTYSLLPQITKAIQDNGAATGTPTTPITPAAATRLSGTLSSSSASSLVGRLADGDLNTYFNGDTAGTAANPEWVTLDLGSAKELTEIKYAARVDAPWTMAGGVFQAANNANFSDGVDLFSVNSTPTAGLHTMTVSGTYRYVRYLAPIGSYGNIAEMQVFGRSAAANNTNTAKLGTPFAQTDKVITLIDDQ